MGGYFQIGNHNIEAAKQVQKFIDLQLKEELNAYQNGAMKAYLMRCLEISYSHQYREQIRTVLENDQDEHAHEQDRDEHDQVEND